MTEKLNTWSVQWLGVVMLITIVCVCPCVYVCYMVSRWVYVIRAVQADAELMLRVGGCRKEEASLFKSTG